MKAFRSIALLIVLMVVAPLGAAVDPCLPKKPAAEDHLVHQYTPFLDPHEVEHLDNKLRRFAQETSNRILVIVVDDLCDMEPWQFATEVGESWGVGDKGFDNGVVVLVKPTGGPGQRQIFIATGRGLEGAIPDAIAGRIVEEQMKPLFREGHFAAGLEKSTDTLMGLAKGEYHMESKNKVPAWPVLLIIVLFIFFIVMAWRNGVKRYARTNDIDFWTAMWLLNQQRRTHRGHWGGFTGGGGGGGGFGGFGGGSFGGGGAGGSW